MPDQPELQHKLRIIPIASTSCRLVRILCFDAGGAGCVSSLAILRKIMRPDGPDDSAHPELEELYPCRHFELFCGSEWGAVLAVMLGRLRMGIQECQDWFAQLDVIEALHLREETTCYQPFPLTTATPRALS